MFEIELKAHVDDWDAVESKLNENGKFLGHFQRNDTYYKFENSEKEILKPRIREELSFEGNPKKIIFTYKQKEVRKNDEGTSYEVNNEKECSVSSKAPIEALLFDAGFSVDLKKTKGVYDWEVNGVLCELCTVPPLGDFLELEVMVSDDMIKKHPNVVEYTRGKLEDVLDLCEIPRNKIEERYYSDMIKETENN